MYNYHGINFQMFKFQGLLVILHSYVCSRTFFLGVGPIKFSTVCIRLAVIKGNMSQYCAVFSVVNEPELGLLVWL